MINTDILFAFFALALGCFFLLLYFGKVTTGKGEQHAAMLRQHFGPLFLVVGIAAVVSGVVDLLRVMLYP